MTMYLFFQGRINFGGLGFVSEIYSLTLQENAGYKRAGRREGRRALTLWQRYEQRGPKVRHLYQLQTGKQVSHHHVLYRVLFIFFAF